ncbi:TetR/AcrR family transcriptional regulator [Gordonia neofelifaecis]|uniref:Tetr family transcriptional regulator n=1 Tax=Gordonia neofelifaecis NRRL B-59395 TaxID=644548 RepID=F1YPG1_9ACTN|nr:TetR/AcrR family transcriptional regulator [Gordonia neofelifaecis]EGD53412.1 tetr family transcriptional regulator [Gordonia neofelifaecis NRRL B-59395]
MTPPRPRSESAADARRAEILAVAARLFARKGIEATSVREIADGVGLNPGALYHYFPSKGDIAGTLITGYLTDLLADYRAAGLDDREPRDRLRAIVEVSLRTGASRPDATKVYHAEFPELRTRRDYARAGELTTIIQQIWLDAIESGKDAGILRTDVPTKIFHRFLRDAVWFSVYWRRPDDEFSVAELSELCVSLFLDGMGTKPA